MRASRFTILSLMLVIGAVAGLLAIIPSGWKTFLVPGQHRHRIVGMYRGQYVSPSGTVVRAGIVTVFDDGCVVGD